MVNAQRILIGTVGISILVTAGCSAWRPGFASAASGTVAVLDDVKPARLRCEYLVNPLAINTSQPRLSWIIESEGRAVQQSAYQILVASSPEILAQNQGDLWDTGRTPSDEFHQIVYAGKPLQSGQEVYWKVRVWTRRGMGASSAGQADIVSDWSAPAAWRMGLLTPADWKAKWIGAPGTVPEGRLPRRPSPVLRKEFALKAPVKRALVSATALGVYELRLNGNRVGDQILAPEWTNYHKRIQYQTYDVTNLLRQGDNAVGATLGDGWYAGRLGISFILGDKNDPVRGFYGKQLGLLMQLEVEYADGSKELIVTDNTWKVTTDGPIRMSDILDGETYDARKEMPGWDGPGFDDSKWGPVEVLPAPKAALLAQYNEPIRITQDIVPVALTEPKPGVYVFDLGQNIAGWCRIRVQGKPGEPITLRHAEVLNADGTLYLDNLRVTPAENHGARAEDRYIPRTDGEEVWEPHFTYHGFRYVEVTGLPKKPGLLAVTGRVQHSAPPPAGSFECSSPLLNKLMANIVWTLRDNLPSVPTDCPQRDERMGWMGDMLVFAQPACFLLDMAAFFTKWTQDIRDDQADDGRYPDFAPHPFNPNQRFSGAPAWGDCGVVVPWRTYQNYADKRILEIHFESARRWVDWIHKHNPNLLWQKNRNNDYGDWLNGDTLKLEMFGFKSGQAEVPKEVFATAFFQQSADLVARMADVIGRKEEAAKYRKLADDIKAAFQKAYISPEGEVKGNTQSAYALALNLNLMPDQLRERAAQRMVERIDAYKGHISTGFHTTVMLMNELTRNGYDEVAYKLINNTTIPSWGYTIDKGGTTVWERWDGYVEGRGFQDPGMNSFCHYAIGSVGEWMYRAILGINPDDSQPGYRRFILRPRPGGGLTYARGSYDSISGPIVSAWSVEGDTLSLMVQIPANTTATVYVPATDAANVAESGMPITGEVEGLKFVRMEKDTAVLEIGSGTYWFTSKGFKKP
ncbi:MAG TPA: glycoside hydrolase family 78 protein [Phycisphaerae bacterium]|nr:family 78 glycoside hydrolase catalytic domain [Phycisphaerae bacterium]HOB74476.1 glycoside hydrolase family 78 protein [Phycisphaerae bacterium]HOJ54304.1 glycoside hydrolase family 78 protein [Phycisphaerae bacterium]HOL26775.1 glycoside hydrolase family 78 protein [Phycisphaerae bacterium]HPP20661.1 glycoside hydrolase family 78 protein [Phycisphaerae bacterium]